MRAATFLDRRSLAPPLVALLVSVSATATASAETPHPLPPDQVSSALAVHASSASTVHRVTLPDAIRVGAAQGPGLSVAQAPRAAVIEAQRAAGSLFPILPRATVAVGDRTGPSGRGVEVGVTVVQDISLGGLRGARRNAAAALERLTEADVARARIEAAARSGIAWIAVWEADRIFELRRQGIDQALALLAAAKARVLAGVVEPLSRSVAEGEVAAARASIIEAEGMRFEAATELVFALGLPGGEAVDATGGLGEVFANGSLASEGGIVRPSREHPSVLVAEAQRERALREGQLAQATLAPVVGVGASFVREGTGDRVWSGILSVPLPFARPGAYEAARGRAAADAAEAQAHAARAELGHAMRLAIHDREHMREVHDALEHGALGPMREGLRLSLAQYDAGTLDVTHVLLARQRLRAVEEQLVRSSAEVRRADIRLLRAMGTLVPEVAQ